MPAVLAGQRHEFMIKSWANGTEHRRVFVLEQVRYAALCCAVLCCLPRFAMLHCDALCF